MRRLITIIFLLVSTLAISQTNVAETHWSTQSIKLRDNYVTDIKDTVSDQSTDYELATAKGVFEALSTVSVIGSEFEYLSTKTIPPASGKGYFSADTIYIYKVDSRGVNVGDAVNGAVKVNIRTTDEYVSYTIKSITMITDAYMVIIDLGKGSVPPSPIDAKRYLTFQQGQASSGESMFGYEFQYEEGTSPPSQGKTYVDGSLININKNDLRGIEIENVLSYSTHIRIRNEENIDFFKIISVTEETNYFRINTLTTVSNTPSPLVGVGYISFDYSVAEASSVNEHTDVDTSGVIDGYILKYNSGKFVIARDETGAGAQDVNDLTDVNSLSRIDNSVMKWSVSQDAFITGVDNTGASELNELSDVSTTGQANGKILKFNGTSWVVGTDETGSGGGATVLGDLTDVNTAGYADGKVLTSDASGNATYEYPFYMTDGTGWGITSGGTPAQKQGDFQPWNIPTQSNPIASNIQFPVDYSSTARLLTFQQVSTLMQGQQVYMRLHPETTILMYTGNWNAQVIEDIGVTLWDGASQQIDIETIDNTDFTYTVKNCTAGYDRVSNDTLFFDATITTADKELIYIIVTHTPSGATQTWQVQWSETSPGGGGGISTEVINDGAVTSVKLASTAVTATNGLTATNNQVSLGGTIAGSTIVYTAGNNLVFRKSAASHNPSIWLADEALTIQAGNGSYAMGLEFENDVINVFQSGAHSAAKGMIYDATVLDDIAWATAADGTLTPKKYIVDNYIQTGADPFTAWDKDYSDLINKPTIIDWAAASQGTIHATNYVDNNTQLSDGNIGAMGYIKTYTETDPIYVAWDKDYDDLTNTPTIVDWTASGQGTIHSTNYVDNNTQLSDGNIGAMGYIKTYAETDPVYSAWDKDYNDLINKPTIPSTPSGLEKIGTSWRLIGETPTLVSGYTHVNDLEVNGRISIVGSGRNIFIGEGVGDDNDGNLNQNTALGYQSLHSNTTGHSNIAVGSFALNTNITGHWNCAIGPSALQYSTASGLIAIGVNSLGLNTSGQANLAIGTNALKANLTGSYNVGIGNDAMRYTVGYNNTAVGWGALKEQTTGGSNTAFGYIALGLSVSTAHNVAIGYDAFSKNISGNSTTTLGALSGTYLTNGTTANEQSHDGLYIGYDTRSFADYTYNEIVIGADALGKGSNKVVLGNDAITDIYLSEDAGAKVHAGQYILSDLNTAPSSATDTGVKGEIRITAGFVYVCTATNTWVRTALSTW